MDFDSWKPEDTSRRYAMFLGSCFGVFSFIALWLGLSLNLILAALGGFAAGFILFRLSYPLILNYYKR